jgi:hypothetical protein
MSKKEVTLEELANGATKSKNNTRPVGKPTNNYSPTQESSTKANIKNAVNISTSSLGDKLREKNGIKKDDEVKDAPVVENAFNDMVSTLNERKEKIENEFMPIVMKNAEDMALAKEMGIDPSKVKLDEIERDEEVVQDIPGSESNDEFNIENYDPDEEVEDVKPNNDEEVVQDIPTATIPEKTEEPKKESNTTKTVEIEKDDDDENTSSSNDVNDQDDLDSLMKDLEDEEAKLEEEEDEETSEELRTRFKESLESVKITKNPIDLNVFTISKTPTSSSSVLTSISTDNNYSNKRADWVLYHTGRSVTFTECRGPELDNVRKTINNSNDINGVIASLRFIYNHIVDANKPDFEIWCKSIRTEDIESLYFGLYRACYADANLVARACMHDNGGCGKTSLIDTDINEMVKFENDEVKTKFYSILNQDTTSPANKIKSTLLQISDDFIVSYSMPTLYSTFIQYSTLKAEVTEKYSDVLDTMAYIDGFYKIDRANQQLIPISINKYPKNINKTVLSKLKVYTGILKSLTNDQYSVLTAKLNNIVETPKVTYIYPKAECPECGTTIPEETVDSVLNLLFTRAQLVQIKSL